MENGGLGLIDIAAKCHTFFLTRLRVRGRDGTLTAAWLHAWDLLAPRENPHTYERYHKNSSIYASML
jgi:hypothetical protein